MEHDKVEVPREVAEKLAALYETDIDDFVDYTGREYEDAEDYSWEVYNERRRKDAMVWRYY